MHFSRVGIDDEVANRQNNRRSKGREPQFIDQLDSKAPPEVADDDELAALLSVRQFPARINARRYLGKPCRGDGWQRDRSNNGIDVITMDETVQTSETEGDQQTREASSSSEALKAM